MAMATKIFKKLISGSDTRISRLHDEYGNFIKFKQLIFNAPRAVCSAGLQIIFGIRPQKPWISYSAISIIKDHLTSSSRVLEFGSGMSTIWYARNSRYVVSVEDNKEWFKIVDKMLKKNHIKNIDHKLIENSDEYCSCAANQNLFDLIMIDGSYRAECMAKSLDYLAPGGMVYLDNSDKFSSDPEGDNHKALRILKKFAEKNNFIYNEITDFAPAQLFVQQGSYVVASTKKDQ